MKNEMKNGPVKVAIIENGEITGWREVPAWQPAPMSPEDWAKTPEGKKCLKEKLDNMEKKGIIGIGDDSDLQCTPRWSARSREFFWFIKML